MEIAPHGPGSTLRLTDPVVRAVHAAHGDAARGLGVRAGASAPAVDAGMAGPGIRAVVAALGATTGDLSRVNRILAEAVRAAADDLHATDGLVATRLVRSPGAAA